MPLDQAAGDDGGIQHIQASEMRWRSCQITWILWATRVRCAGRTRERDDFAYTLAWRACPRERAAEDAQL